MRILLIDDNPADRQLAAREIRRSQPKAVLVEIGSSEEVERELARDNFVLCVVDYSIGWTNGFELLKRIREREPDCPVILFTGALGDEAAAEAIKSGFDDYILKSVERLPRLRTSVDALIKQRTERQARRRAEARYRALFENVTVGVFASTNNGSIEDANEAIVRQLGVPSIEALRGRSILDLLSSDGLREAWRKMVSGETADGITELEVEISGRPEPGWALLDAHPIDEGRNQIEGVMTNITALRRALDQRSALLGEVYHRVHNNLQIVQSLLAFQSRQFKEPEVRDAFDDVSARIQALSLVQQQLYRSEDYVAVDFATYLHALTDALLQARVRPELSAKLDTEPLRLSIDQAMPLGLIANELLTNVLKHAFPDSRPGEILVTFRCAEDAVEFSVADNGVGLLLQPTAAEGAGLGSRLVPRLARQLGAEVTTKSDRGHATTIRFVP